MTVLNKRFGTYQNTPPFSKIKTTDFLPAFKLAMEKANKEIEKIISDPRSPSFENTIEALEYSGQELERISSIFFNLNAANTSKDIQRIAKEVTPLLSKFSNNITLNTDLFKRVEKAYENSRKLNKEQERLLEKKYKSFARNGARLDSSQKAILKELDIKLSQLQLTFGENILEETNRFELLITDASNLSGLPDGAIEAASAAASERNKKGWVFTLDFPSYLAFMTYADNRKLRKKLFFAFGKRGFNKNELDNQNNVIEIAQLRHQRAELLGYASHAHFVLEERMAKTPGMVKVFLEDLLEKALPTAQKEFETLEKFAKSISSIKRLEQWDSAYFSEKLKQKLFGLNDELLKPYFKLENVIQGAFAVAEKLFDIQFKETSDIETYHKDVIAYKVMDKNQQLLAIFYADFFPRSGKRNGAWMTSYKPQFIYKESNERPQVSIVCNFTKPTASKPSLLTFNEVTTLFHEFGHALHGIFANTTYPSLSGTNVSWDFVELPSQLMENWCYEKEALEMFAKHYQTKETLPMELIAKIKAASNFQQGIQTIRQISFGLLDMSWHANDPSKIKNVKEHEDLTFHKTKLYPNIEKVCMSTAFSHIFQGGYSAGYYSYKWAEVLDADAFELFKKKGVFNKEIAHKLIKFILSKGGTEQPDLLYKKFRGHAPKPEALLRRSGLLS